MSAPSGGDVEAQPEDLLIDKHASQRLARGSPLHTGAATYGAVSEPAQDDMEPSQSTSSNQKGVKNLVRQMVFKQFTVHDASKYHAEDLSSWNSLWHISHTVWNRSSLWLVTLKLFVLSFFVALLVLVSCRDPASLRVSKFTEISNFLRVFVGLLLGFFMSASVNRWWSCAEAFQKLCSTVREMHIFLNSCGVPEEQIKQVARYGVVSAWILHMQLHVEVLPVEKQAEALEAGWEKIEIGEGPYPELGTLSTDELDVLRSTADPPGVLSMWTGSLIGSLAQDGVIPPLASPTYGRIMGVTVQGFNAIRDVRSFTSVQAPFIYVHMLSSLVHINNIVNALSFGLTWGASVGTMLVYWGSHFNESRKAEASQKQATTDTQTLLVSFFFSCFGPFVYQALLEVSIAIAQPFSNEDAVVPTKRMISMLERDLHEAMALAKQISWEQPRFKKQ